MTQLYSARTLEGTNQKVTIKELVKEYALEHAELQRRSRSWKSHAKAVEAFFGADTHITEAVGKCRAWVAHNRDVLGNSPQTLQCKLGFLSSLCRLANENGVAASVPKRVSASIIVDNARERTLSPRELRKLESEFPVADWKICLAAKTTGLRSQELFLLEVVDCDFRSKTASIRRTKTGRSRRIPLMGPLYDLALAAARGRRRYVVNPTGYDNWTQRHAMADHWKLSVFRPALKRAGIVDFRWHDWRHQASTDMSESGASEVAIATVMGWKDTKYLRRYTNLRMKSLRKSMAAIQ